MDVKIIYISCLQLSVSNGTAGDVVKRKHCWDHHLAFPPVDEALENLLILGGDALIIFAKPIITVLCNVIIDS
uniref:Uncharacterized protein n=1 Tax=Arundo donax TaxID=35708 RepID=A0A0A8Y1K3_ARUDO